MAEGLLPRAGLACFLKILLAGIFLKGLRDLLDLRGRSGSPPRLGGRVDRSVLGLIEETRGNLKSWTIFDFLVDKKANWSFKYFS